jgi:hypothetical protein
MAKEAVEDEDLPEWMKVIDKLERSARKDRMRNNSENPNH